MRGTTISRRILQLLRGTRAGEELAEEMQLHMSLRAAKRREQGVDENDAVPAARRRFGNPTVLREESRDSGGWRWLEGAWLDFFALRWVPPADPFFHSCCAKASSMPESGLLLMCNGAGADTPDELDALRRAGNRYGYVRQRNGSCGSGVCDGQSATGPSRDKSGSDGRADE
jgi:hypothetical protein